MKCSDCRFYQELPSAFGGECRIEPPTRITVGLMYDSGHGEFKSHSGWPTVTPEDWCGFFSPKTVDLGGF